MRESTERFRPGRAGVTDLLEVLAGPVVKPQACLDEARASEEHARRPRYDPPVD